jgi:mannose/fructose/N-acetylgalactosamine-specific phosphotransferase system component IIC
MSPAKKTTWGSPGDWWSAIGIMLAVIGLLALISSFWTPDVADYVATGFLGSSNIVPSVVILVLGVVIAVAARFIKPKA